MSDNVCLKCIFTHLGKQSYAEIDIVSIMYIPHPDYMSFTSSISQTVLDYIGASYLFT